MSTFRFGRAAEEYAKYFDAVEAVRERFRHEVDEFLRAVERELRELGLLGVKTLRSTDRYYYWWISDNGESRETHPYLWCEPYKPGTILGEVVLYVCSRRSRKYVQVKEQVDSAVEDNEFKYRLFRFSIRHKSDTPAREFAEQISRVLHALRKLELELRANGEADSISPESQ